MRYGAEHKARVRGRIVHAAARRFRNRGTGGAAIASLMRDLRLTHGGFYRHFASKEALVAEAFDAALQDSGRRLAAVAAAAPRGQALEAIVHAYLDLHHCEDAADGCPVAALGAELARRPAPVRSAFSRALARHALRMAAFMPGPTRALRIRQARMLFAAMPGSLTAARLMSDPRQRARFLADARRFIVRAVRRARPGA